jgi:hypothetical protein
MRILDDEHNPGDWLLLRDSSKQSLKPVLLHNENDLLFFSLILVDHAERIM